MNLDQNPKNGGKPAIDAMDAINQNRIVGEYVITWKSVSDLIFSDLNKKIVLKNVRIVI